MQDLLDTFWEHLRILLRILKLIRKFTCTERSLWATNCVHHLTYLQYLSSRCYSPSFYRWGHWGSRGLPRVTQSELRSYGVNHRNERVIKPDSEIRSNPQCTLIALLCQCFIWNVFCSFSWAAPKLFHISEVFLSQWKDGLFTASLQPSSGFLCPWAQEQRTKEISVPDFINALTTLGSPKIPWLG